MPEEQSVISGIQARYNHDNTIPKTLDPADQVMTSNGKIGFQVFNNPQLQTSHSTTLGPPKVQQATDPGEGIDHYKKLFSFSK